MRPTFRTSNPHLYGRICNCAACGRHLLKLAYRDWWAGLSDQERQHLDLPLPVETYINNQPYCGWCYRPDPRQGGWSGPPEQEGGPWEQNAVRAWEDRFDGLD